MRRSATRAGASTRGQATRWAEPLVVVLVVWLQHVFLFFSLFYLERMRIMMKVGESFFLPLIGWDERSDSNWLFPVCRGSGEHPGAEEEEKRGRREQ